MQSPRGAVVGKFFSFWRAAATPRLVRLWVYEQANYWGCEEFLPKFSQTCLKNTQRKMTSKKYNIFSNQSTSSTIYAQISLKLPKKN